ncbi:hypothetical protein MSP8886_04229 [Marinomonas spartinae]|uniref:Uncharacterized protein n=1 Tax=Marinomonas spartinae TaxID=1792290 RepID=A0A1A8TTE0_9GAMM|nr:hypothetical protein [Marinomonas spartinae]SBS37699.1 hypothetical protein MSP8886_04229 [Marinomonas spartinae]
MDSDFLAISSSDGSVSITANTFGKNGGHFEAFAEYRFSSLQDLYISQSDVSPIKCDVLRECEYESTRQNEAGHSYYCSSSGWKRLC